MTKKNQTHTIELSHETYELLQQVKKAFVSYTGESLEDRSDGKVVDVLTGGFFDSMVRGELDGEHEHNGCCEDSHCSDSPSKKDSCCGGACKS